MGQKLWNPSRPLNWAWSAISLDMIQMLWLDKNTKGDGYNVIQPNPSGVSTESSQWPEYLPHKFNSPKRTELADNTFFWCALFNIQLVQRRSKKQHLSQELLGKAFRGRREVASVLAALLSPEGQHRIACGAGIDVVRGIRTANSWVELPSWGKIHHCWGWHPMVFYFFRVMKIPMLFVNVWIVTVNSPVHWRFFGRGHRLCFRKGKKKTAGQRLQLGCETHWLIIIVPIKFASWKSGWLHRILSLWFLCHYIPSISP